MYLHSFESVVFNLILIRCRFIYFNFQLTLMRITDSRIKSYLWNLRLWSINALPAVMAFFRILREPLPWARCRAWVTPPSWPRRCCRTGRHPHRPRVTRNPGKRIIGFIILFTKIGWFLRRWMNSLDIAAEIHKKNVHGDISIIKLSIKEQGAKPIFRPDIWLKIG